MAKREKVSTSDRLMNVALVQQARARGPAAVAALAAGTAAAAEMVQAEAAHYAPGLLGAVGLRRDRTAERHATTTRKRKK